MPGQHVPDRQILDHAIRLIETYCPLNAVQHGLTQHERVFPSEWIHRATRRAILQAQGKGQLARIRWSWMQRILKEWDFLGEPDPGVEDDYDRNLQYLPTSQRTSHRPAPTIAQRAPSRVPLQPPRRPQLSEEQLERQGREALAFLAAKLNRIPPPTTGAQASNRESNATVPSPATSRQPSSENRGNRVGDLLPPFPAMQNEPAQPVVS